MFAERNEEKVETLFYSHPSLPLTPLNPLTKINYSIKLQGTQEQSGRERRNLMFSPNFPGTATGARARRRKVTESESFDELELYGSIWLVPEPTKRQA